MAKTKDAPDPKVSKAISVANWNTFLSGEKGRYLTGLIKELTNTENGLKDNYTQIYDMVFRKIISNTNKEPISGGITPLGARISCDSGSRYCLKKQEY